MPFLFFLNFFVLFLNFNFFFFRFRSFEFVYFFYKREEITSPQKDKNALANNLKIDLPTEIQFKLKKQMEIDCTFLSKHNIIDYSLLVGIHHKKIGGSVSTIEEYKILAALGQNMIYDQNTINVHKHKPFSYKNQKFSIFLSIFISNK